MCGRYAHTRTPDQLLLDFNARLGEFFEPIEPDWNMAPTRRAPIVVGRDGESHHARVRELVTARWGLVPSWAKDASIGNRLINARSETVAEKRAFRSAFAKRRAIVPVDGYYEWVTSAGGLKQPYYLSVPAGLALAGLYEWWRDPAESWRLSFTILTTSAEGEDGRIHDRAPLLVPDDVIDEWLAAEPAPDLVHDLIPATPGRLEVWPVDPAVGNVRNNGPQLIEPQLNESS